MRRRSRRRSWLSGGMFMGFLLALTAALGWKFGWLPFDVGEPETGTLLEADADAAGGTPNPLGSTGPADDAVEIDPIILTAQTEPAFEAEPTAGFENAEPGRRNTADERALSGRQWDDPPFPDVPPRFPAANVVQVSNEQVTVAEPAASEPPASFPAPSDPPALSPAAAAPVEFAEIDRLLEAGDLLAAHRDLSKIYWSRPELRPAIKSRIENTARSIYLSPQPHFLEPYVIEPGDQLRTIAGKYHVTWNYLAKLNRIDPRKIRPGQKLKVLKGPFAAVVDLSDYEITLHAHGYFVCRYPVGIGKDGSSPIGTFTVHNKVVNPQYTDPDGRVVAADDPNNPLGERWIDLGDSYGVHGTIDPTSIGRAESRGCIRLRNEDVEEVYDLLTVGSQVVIQR